MAVTLGRRRLPERSTCSPSAGRRGDDIDCEVALELEVSISTHYHGRNGSRSARAYLASPYVVAASAVAGRIADPRVILADTRAGA